jgi:hypothetical protein
LVHTADDDTHADLDRKGKALLNTLERVFPYRVKIAPRSDESRSIWNTEKVHSILHGSRNLKKVGRSRNISCQVTESKLKDVKAKGHMTNRDPATYGYSIMAGAIREAAAQQMAIDADQYGMYWLIYVHIGIQAVRICPYLLIYVYELFISVHICPSLTAFHVQASPGIIINVGVYRMVSKGRTIGFFAHLGDMIVWRWTKQLGVWRTACVVTYGRERKTQTNSPMRSYLEPRPSVASKACWK